MRTGDKKALAVMALGAGAVTLGSIGLGVLLARRERSAAPSPGTSPADPGKAAQGAAQGAVDALGITIGPPAPPGPTAEEKVAQGVKVGGQVAGTALAIGETIAGAAGALGGT